jgi:hypothetical protein
MIIEALCSYVNNWHTDWAVHLTHVESVFNNSMNASIGFAPNKLVYGTTVHLFSAFKRPFNSPVPAVTKYLLEILD